MKTVRRFLKAGTEIEIYLDGIHSSEKVKLTIPAEIELTIDQLKLIMEKKPEILVGE